MSRVDQVLARYGEFETRAERKLRDLAETDAGRAATRRVRARGGGRSLITRAKRAANAMLAVGIIVIVLAFISPIGIDGFLLALFLAALAGGAVMLWPRRREPDVTTAEIVNAELGALPVRVERWLMKRKADLPKPARTQCDEIILRLEVLAPQLEAVSADAPVVHDARRLIGDHLPRLVESYTKVPEAYRGPDSDAARQLHEGLDTLSGELKRLSEQLAKGDLDRLAIEGKFIEAKYKGSPADRTAEAE